MKKQIFLRIFIILSLITIMSFILLLSSNFARSAVISVLATFGLILLVAIVVAWMILRK